MSALLTAWHSFLDAVGAAHPALLFFGLAILPLVGVPVSALWIAAGLRLGTGVGFLFSASALVLTYTIGYWLARQWLRRPLLAFMRRRGWRVPQFSGSDETLVILLLRLTPGIPLFAQNYLLGLAEVGFYRYLLLSVALQFGHVLAFVWLGNSLATNALWKVVLGIGALASLGVFVMLLRRRLGRGMATPAVRAELSET